jgi:hypothetical protein
MSSLSFLEPARAFAEIGRIPFGSVPLADALNRITHLVRRSVPDVSEVSVTMAGPDGAHTAAFTGRCALLLDEWQYRNGTGPCLIAALGSVIVQVPDTATENRWPEWAARAATAGVHSALSAGIPLRRSVCAALNIYAGRPYAFGEDAAGLARTFASYVAVAEANQAVPEVHSTFAQTAAALHDRAVIEQAQGIIMAERRCRADDATAVLASIARYTRRTVLQVAADLIAASSPAPRDG